MPHKTDITLKYPYFGGGVTCESVRMVHAGVVSSFSFSPDGTHASLTIYLYDADTIQRTVTALQSLLERARRDAPVDRG